MYVLDFSIGLLAFILLTAGINYKASYKYPLMPGIFVAYAAAWPLLIVHVKQTSTQHFLLIFATILLVFGREVIKDIDDMQIDEGYKWTLPVKIGERLSRFVVAVLYSGAFLLVVGITPYVLATTPIFAATVVYSVYGKSSKSTKSLGDVSLVIGLLIILVNEIAQNKWV